MVELSKETFEEARQAMRAVAELGEYEEKIEKLEEAGCDVGTCRKLLADSHQALTEWQEQIKTEDGSGDEPMTRRHLITAALALLAAPGHPFAVEWPFAHEGACLQLGGGYGGAAYGACTYGAPCSCLPPGVHRFEDPIFADGFESGDTGRWG